MFFWNSLAFSMIQQMLAIWFLVPLPFWRRQWHPTPVLLPGKSRGRRAWWAAVHGVAMSRTWLSNFTFTFYFHALEKEMATHSSVLAWRIPRDGGAWWAAVCGVAQSRTRLKRLSSSNDSKIFPFLKHLLKLIVFYWKLVFHMSRLTGTIEFQSLFYSYLSVQK